MGQGGVERATVKLCKRLRVSGPTRLFMSYWQFVRFPVSSDIPTRGWSYVATYNPQSCTFLFPLHTHTHFSNPLARSPSCHNGLCVCVCSTLTGFPPPPAELSEIDFVSRAAFPKGFLFLAFYDEKSKFLDFPPKTRFFV